MALPRRKRACAAVAPVAPVVARAPRRLPRGRRKARLPAGKAAHVRRGRRVVARVVARARRGVRPVVGGGARRNLGHDARQLGAQALIAVPLRVPGAAAPGRRLPGRLLGRRGGRKLGRRLLRLLLRLSRWREQPRHDARLGPVRVLVGTPPPLLLRRESLRRVRGARLRGEPRRQRQRRLLQRGRRERRRDPLTTLPLSTARVG